MDYLEVENVGENLEATADLLQLLDEESEEVFEALNRVKKADSKIAEAKATNDLIILLENRFNIMDTLQNTVSKNVANDRNALNALINKELADRRQSTKGDANNANSKL